MIWRAISDFEKYEVSDAGLVWSHYVSRTLSPRRGDYLTVTLTRRGQLYIRAVHVLVLEAFVGPRPDGLMGLHRDDNKHHNHVSNLYWGTHSENALDEVANGHHFNANKEECKRGHLLEQPNLVPSQLAKGFRSCLACLRALSSSRWHGHQGDQEWIQRIADERFAMIMGAT